NMEAVLKLVVLGRACRNTANIKNRQPIGRMFVKADFKFKNESGEMENGLAKFYTDIIEDELNIKEVIYTEDVREFTTYIIKPLLNVLGPKYGKKIGQIRQELNKLDGNRAMDELNEVGKLKLELKDETIVIDKDDLLIESTQKESYISDSNNGVTVVVDTTLSEELIEEGFVREIISKIQTMRKDADFEVMDRIIVYQKANDKIKEIMENNAEEIKSEVLADEIILDDSQGFTKEWNLNGEDVVLGVKKASISCE
ncbi:MAG TPA: isoleucine--tRNA ligase, partial [Clostridiales bacterium]|nr:isoleucine--tRNA ligase [Clostridiales bacterium]